MLTPRERDTLAARAGDQAALHRLLEDYHLELVAFVNGRLPPYLRGQTAEDLVQDAYVALWPKLGTFEWREPDPLAGFHAWLRTFVAGKVKDWWKHVVRLKKNLPGIMSNPEAAEASFAPGSLDQAPGRAETPSQSARRREREDALHQAMHDALTADEQVAIVLRHFEFHSVAEVAAVMQRTPGAVKMLCLRGLQKLREALGRSSEFFSSR